MSKTAYCHKCNKKFVNGDFLQQHITESHPSPEENVSEVKRKGWPTPHGFADFREPVTHQHACEFMRILSAKLEARA